MCEWLVCDEGTVECGGVGIGWVGGGGGGAHIYGLGWVVVWRVLGVRANEMYGWCGWG